MCTQDGKNQDRTPKCFYPKRYLCRVKNNVIRVTWFDSSINAQIRHFLSVSPSSDLFELLSPGSHEVIDENSIKAREGSHKPLARYRRPSRVLKEAALSLMAGSR